MTPAQKRVYEQLTEEFMAFLESGELVTAPLAITRLLRFQQVTSGFIPVDDPEGEPIRDIGETNPRLDALMDTVEDIPHGCIIWARFNRTVDLIMDMLRKAQHTAVGTTGR
jgi:hypothetical protein